MDSFSKGYIFRSVSFLREAHDSSNDNYTQHTPNPRFDLVRLSTAIAWKDSAVEISKKNVELINTIKILNQNIIELLEYSEVDKDVEHVWLNAENEMYKAKELIK